MKVVNFQIKGRYLAAIESGAKTVEYRSISKYNGKLLCDHIDKKDLQPGEQFLTHNNEIWRIKKNLTHVQFLNGYRPERKKLLCELKKIEINEFIKYIPEDMEPGTICFTLTLGLIVSKFNL